MLNKAPFELSRADLFKKLCADEHPNAIVCLGDLGEFDSVSSFDQDKPAVLAGKDLHSDVTVTLEFLERSLGPKSKQKTGLRTILLDMTGQSRASP